MNTIVALSQYLDRYDFNRITLALFFPSLKPQNENLDLGIVSKSHDKNQYQTRSDEDKN